MMIWNSVRPPAGRWLSARRSEITRACCRISGIDIGVGCRIGSSVRLGKGPFAPRPGRFVAGRRLHCDVGAILYTYGGAIEIGDDVYIGPYSVIYGHGGVRIGSGTLFAMGCYVVSADHTIPDRATLIRSQPDVVAPTTIGADCWLGAGTCVLAGVTIGDGCVIGAGAVVASDLPAYSVAVGVPAKVIRFRSEEGADRQGTVGEALTADSGDQTSGCSL